MRKEDREIASILDGLAQELEARYSEEFAAVGGEFHAKRYSSPRLRRVVWGVGAAVETAQLYEHIDLDLVSRPRFGGSWKTEMELAEARRLFEEEISKWTS